MHELAATLLIDDRLATRHLPVELPRSNTSCKTRIRPHLGRDRNQRRKMLDRLVVLLVLHEPSRDLPVDLRPLRLRYVRQRHFERVHHLAPTLRSVVLVAEQLERTLANLRRGSRRPQDHLQKIPRRRRRPRIVEQRLHRSEGAVRVVEILEPARRNLLARRKLILAREHVETQTSRSRSAPGSAAAA